MKENIQDLLIMFSLILSSWSFIWLWAKIFHKEQEEIEKRLDALESRSKSK